MSADREELPLLGRTNSPHAASRKSRSKRLLVVIACGFLVFGAQFGTYLTIPSQTAIFEDIICRKHLQLHGPWDSLPDASPNGDFCKSEEVQAELALVIGYKDGLDMIPAILLSLPYGILADHWGRRPVILLSILGCLLSELWLRLIPIWSSVLPLRLVWLAPIWYVIGGGDQVATSIAMVMVADVCSEEELSTTFFRLSACSLIAEVLATPCSAWLMTYNPWLPFLLGYAIVFLGFFPSLLLPETLETIEPNDPIAPSLSGDAFVESSEPRKALTIKSMLHKGRAFKDAALSIWQDRNVTLIILAVSASTSVMSPQLINILLQFASKKFRWSFARASLLVSARGIFSSCNFLIVLPTWNYLAGKFLDLHGKYRDYRTSQGSGIFLILGFTIMAFAPRPEILIIGIIVMSLGTAQLMASRSLATESVPQDHVGTLYSVIGILSAISTLIASPLMAYLFKIGIHLGEAWIGLPLLQGSFLCLISTVAIWRVRLGDSSGYWQEQANTRDMDDETPLASSE